MEQLALPGAYEFGPAGPAPPVLMEPAGSKTEVAAGASVACPGTPRVVPVGPAPVTPDGTHYVHSALMQNIIRKRNIVDEQEPRLFCKVARLEYTWTIGKRLCLSVEGQANELVYDCLSLDAEDRCSSLSLNVLEPSSTPVDNATDIATCVFKTLVDLKTYKEVQSTEIIQVKAESSIFIRGHSKPGSVVTGELLTEGKGKGRNRS